MTVPLLLAPGLRNVHHRPRAGFSEEGVRNFLSGAGQVRLAEAPSGADVFLLLAGNVTEHTVAVMRKTARSAANPHLRLVLIAKAVTEQQILCAMECGLSCLLLRPGTTYSDILAAIRRSGREASMPGFAMRLLADYVRRTREQSVNGLSERDLQVLRMVADGAEMSEIAGRLGYSERTIKNILKGSTKRLSLRNRAHAASYAIRAGLV